MPAYTQKILIVDDDDTICQILKNFLWDVRISDVKIAHSVKEAWEHLQVKPVDFMILDWKFPDIGGAGLLNRVRNDDRFILLPVIVSSGLLDNQDRLFLEECFLVSQIEKPPSSTDLLQAMALLQKESQWILDSQAQLTKICSAVHDDASAQVEALQKILTGSARPVYLGVAAARKLIKMNLLDEAESLLMSLQGVGASIAILHTLGEIKLLKKDSATAYSYLKTAYEKSPKNIKRLNILGDIALFNRKFPEAETYFGKSLSIDRENLLARSGLKICQTMAWHIKENGVGSVTSFSSLLNSIAITHATRKEFDEAIETFKMACSHLFPGDKKFAAKILFNIGLAFIRSDRPNLSLSYFQEAVTVDPPMAKAQKLMDDVESFLKKLVDRGEQLDKPGVFTFSSALILSEGTEEEML